MYKNDRVVRYIDYNPIKDTEAFFYNILLQHIAFRSEVELYLAMNVKKSYVTECRIRGYLSNLESLQDYVFQYAQRNFYDESRQKHLLDNLLEKYPYLDPDYVGALEVHDAEETSNVIGADEENCFRHNFKEEMIAAVLTSEQQCIFDGMTKSLKGIHFLEGTLGSRKSFFIK